MDTKETIGWLKIMRANLKNFPEICNGETANAAKKIEALTNAIDIVEHFRADQDRVIESAYKTGFELGRLEGMSDSVPYLMHKKLGAPISECQKAYDAAMEYLRSQAKVKG